MVNLFLTGRARSNVFNDVMELENDTGPALVLKGIDCRQSIGFLSLFEHYQSCQVSLTRLPSKVKAQMASGQGNHWLMESPTIFHIYVACPPAIFVSFA